MTYKIVVLNFLFYKDQIKLLKSASDVNQRLWAKHILFNFFFIKHGNNQVSVYKPEIQMIGLYIYVCLISQYLLIIKLEIYSIICFICYLFRFYLLKKYNTNKKHWKLEIKCKSYQSIIQHMFYKWCSK